MGFQHAGAEGELQSQAQGNVTGTELSRGANVLQSWGSPTVSCG